MKDDRTNGNKPEIMKKLLFYLRPYRFYVAVSFVSLVVASLAELLVPVLIQHSVDSNILGTPPNIAGLGTDCLILLTLLFLGLGASFFQIYLMSAAGLGIMKTLRIQLLEHTLGQSLSYLGGRPVGSLVTRITNDVETISEFFSSVVMTLIKNFFVMAGVLGVLFYLDKRLALITILTLPPAIIITLLFRVRAGDAYRRVRKGVSAINAFLSEHISGIKVIQVFAREKRTMAEFVENNNKLLSSNLSEMYVFAVFRPLIAMSSTISLALIIYFGAGLNQAGVLSLGVLIAYLDLIRKFYHPLQQLSEQFSIMQSAMAGGERVFELLETEDRISEYSRDRPAGVDFCLIAEGRQPAVEFADVHFAYKEGEPVLKGVSFSVAEGETLAIVGYTGAGKSTIANLAARFYDADSGCIRIAGRDIRELPLKTLRRTVQAVQQDVFLFSGTIRENICLGRNFTEEELSAAADTARLSPVLEKLEDGLDYHLSEGGTNLSGGQRQLIAFARVIAHDPAMLILDEATASIDTETEKLIQTGLGNLLKGRTAIVIAHRLSTISDADRILVLSSGRVAESGSHSELMAADGLYSSLYNLQFGRDL
ncbi:MAG: ABC transporter ATP-binding protein [Spirochaetales bacterium]|nr:ABC transporter ATP-binding protein [Spirochaetales bacterium]